MKKYILLTLMSCLSLVVGAQNKQKKCIEVNDAELEKLIESVAKKNPYHDSEGACQEILRDAFKAYFSDGRVAVSVVDEKAIKVREDSIAILEKENRKLLEEKKNNDALLFGMQQEYDQEIHAQDSIKSTEIFARRKLLENKKKELENLQAQNSELKGKIESLGQSVEIANNVNAELKERENAVMNAYQTCINQSLESIRDIEMKRAAIRDYNDYIKFLNIDAPDSIIKMGQTVSVLCDAADLYNQCTKELTKPYDKTAIKSLLDNSSTVDRNLRTLSKGRLQATELQNIMNLLRTEGAAVAYFRENIIAQLLKEGSVPDSQSVKYDLKIIDEAIMAFNAHDPNSAVNNFNPRYTYINKVLEELRNGLKVRGGKQYADGATFRKFLNQISDKLGDK